LKLREQFMPKVDLEFGANYLESAPLIIAAWTVLLLTLLGFSATTELEACTSPPDDYFCDRDADCTIVAKESALHGCNTCNECRVEAFAASRLAVACHAQACGPGACFWDYDFDPCENVRYTTPEYFLAVCINHTCERRPRR
jgi:hypothetical protein